MTLLYGSSARQKLLIGAAKLAKTVSITLGPKGRNVVIDKTIGDPLITKDGVSVAKEVELPDRWENMGARMVRDAASKTSDDAGDGTTTATVLAYALFRESLKLVEAGMSSTHIKRGVDKCVAMLDAELAAMSLDVHSQDDVENIATIAANGDRTLGKLIADAVAKVGRDGVVNIEEGQGLEVTSEVVDGLVLDKGWTHAEFAGGADSLSLDNPAILITDLSLLAPEPLLPVLEAASTSGRPLVFVSPEYGPTFISTLLKNKAVIKACCIRAPGFGHTQYEVLEDLAILTGATFITKHQGMNFECLKDEQLDSPLDHLGSCSKVTVTRYDTTFVEGAGTEEDIDDRIQQIQGAMARCGSEYDADKLRDRLGKLLGGICSIKVGASSEIEIKEIKGRLEDALFATKASVEGGILPGGGTALIRASQRVRYGLDGEVCPPTEYPVLFPVGDEELAGFKAVLDACMEPLKVIIENGGGNGEGWVYRMLEDDPHTDWFMGVDARVPEFCNMLDLGIIDPAKVVRKALGNAASVVGAMMTAEVLLHKNGSAD